MTIVLFGSGGMTGSRIAAELGQRGHDLIGADRSTGADTAAPAEGRVPRVPVSLTCEQRHVSRRPRGSALLPPTIEWPSCPQADPHCDQSSVRGALGIGAGDRLSRGTSCEHR